MTAALVLVSTFALGTQMSYDVDGGPSTAALRTADRISAVLSEGARDPQQVYVRSGSGELSLAQLRPLGVGLAAIDGVSAVGKPALTPDRSGARIDVALDDGPYTEEAMDLVRGPLRATAREQAPAGAAAMVGGTSAVFADVSVGAGGFRSSAARTASRSRCRSSCSCSWSPWARTTTSS